MTGTDPKDDLRVYLQDARDAMLWKLEGLSEYDVRRPMTPTGTNLLGLVKHVTSAEAVYFGEAFGRAFEAPGLWITGNAEPNSDLWARPDETREQIVGLYRRVWDPRTGPSIRWPSTRSAGCPGGAQRSDAHRRSST